MSTFYKAAFAVAAGLVISIATAHAQTTTVVNGYARPDYQRYPTTGSPPGFTMPSVTLPRRNSPQPTLDNSYGSPTAASAGTNSNPVQGSAVAAQPGIIPTPPEDPKAAEAGRVRSDSTKQAAGQDPATSVAAVTNSGPIRYVPGSLISGSAKVFDGHSLLIDGNAIRLDGADAPGLVQTCHSSSGTAWRCGETAYRRLAEMTAGRKVNCRVTEQVGNGAAAICSVTGVADIAAALVREGLAVPNGHDRARYRAAMNTARDGKTGMWSGSFTLPSKWRAANSAPTRSAASR